ncbi:MAG: purine-nucleoside phosphorylase [Deltaproteobacteria bacterium]|nr:purine-nucleoside phosphorylase [Deltaproteobacteria bacterium]
MKGLYHLKIDPKDISGLVLLPGDPQRSAYIADRFLEGARLINEYRGLNAYTGLYNGRRVSVVTSGMGSPSAGIVVEELSRLGVEVVIRTGTCGGIRKDIKPGDIVIPTGAGSLAGFKDFYGIGEVPSVPDFPILERLVRQGSNGIRGRSKGPASALHIGPIMTSDSFFTEKRDARLLESKGILALEMECAAVFALGHVLGMKTGAILLATGNINYADQVMDTPRIRAAMDRMLAISLRALTD